MLKFVCVKYTSLTTPLPGKELSVYDYNDVNTLYESIVANCTIPFEFYCLTENPVNINSNVNIIPIDTDLGLDRVWWKMCIFDKSLWNSDDIIFYMDLDVKVYNNIDSMCSAPSANKLKTCRIGDRYESSFNSSLLLFNGHEMDHLYTNFIANKTSVIDYYMQANRGIDPYLTITYGRDSWLEAFNYPLDYYNRTALTGDSDTDAAMFATDSDGEYLYRYTYHFVPIDSMIVYFHPDSKIISCSGYHAKRSGPMEDLNSKIASI